MNSGNVDFLRQALPFINKFKGKIFVIKIGGDVAEERDHLNGFCEEVALCAQVGIQIVLVHGGGKQATDFSEKLGLKPVIVEGRRVTDDTALDVVKMVFAGKINVEILSSLRRAGVRAVGLSGVDGNMLHATRRPPQNVGGKIVDFGHVGDIGRVDVSLLRTLLAGDFLPVISSLACDDEGNIFNINADTVASKIAKAIEAEKLILVSDVDGILAEGKTLSRVSEAELRRLLEDGTISGGMRPKVAAAVEALDVGVRSIHIINGMRPSTLLMEVFTDTGSGTMIVR